MKPYIVETLEEVYRTYTFYAESEEEAGQRDRDDEKLVPVNQMRKFVDVIETKEQE